MKPLLANPLRVAWFVGLLSVLLLRTGHADTHAFFAKGIWTGEGDKVVEDAVLVVVDGKVSNVGAKSEVSIPPEAERHDLGNAFLIPGLVIAQSNLVDSVASDPFSISPEVQAVDGFDPFEDYSDLLKAGITSIQVEANGRKLMPGQGGVVRLSSDGRDSVLKQSESLLVNLNQSELSPTTIYEPPVGAVSVDRPLEPTRPQMATSLSQAVVGLRALLSEAAEIVDGKANEDLSLEALADLLKSKTPIRWDVRNNAELSSALRLSNEYGIPWVVTDPQEIDSLVGKEVWESPLARGVVLNPEFRAGRITNPLVPRAGLKEPTPVWTRAAMLINAGAENRIALHAATDSDLYEILFTSRILGRGGISRSQILSMLTSNPARILGVEDQVGSLTKGRFADFVVLSESPMQAASKVVATYSGGKLASSDLDANEPDDSGRPEQKAYTILAKSIYTSNGVLNDASIGVANGKISGVGRDVSSASDAEVKSFPGAFVVPGLIDCGTALGIGGTLSERLNFGSKIADLLARDDKQIALGRQGGVTTALLSSSSLPSPVIAFKLGDQPRAVKDPVALHYRIRGNLTAAEETTRKTLAAGKAYADSWTQYEAKMVEYKKQLKEYEEAKKKYDAAVKAAAAKKAAEEKKKSEEAKESGDSKESDKKESEKSGGEKTPAAKEPDKKDAEKKESDGKEAEKVEAEKKSDDSKANKSESESGLKAPKKPEEPKKPRSISSSEPYRNLFAGELVAIVDVEDSKGLDVAIKLFRKEFKIKTALTAGSATAKNASKLAENDVFVIAGPTLVAVDDGQLINFPVELAVAGAKFGFQSKASTGAKELPSAIAYSVYEGLGTGDALAGLTTSPVEFFGLSGIGEIKSGNDADLVILSGPPFDLASEVLAVMIDGRWVYEKGQ